MEKTFLLNGINGTRGEELFASLYGPDAVERERRRYGALVEGMSVEAGFPPEFAAAEDLRIFSAPGRTELGGNHTDHNRGRVLAAAIQMDAAAVVSPRTDRQVFFRSTGFPDVRVNLDGPDGNPDFTPRPAEQGTTEALVRGIAAEFAVRGVMPGGFSANAGSTVLQGSGLSSSAAVEVLFAKIVDSLYGGGHCSPLELARICQKAENVFFGKPCGLMDQAASASGGAVAIDFADPDAPAVQKIEFNPLAAGFILCVLNTRGSHADLTPDYAAIPQEMRAVARFFNKNYLREVTLADIISNAAQIRRAAGDRALLRAIHFCNEDRRAAEMANLLRETDLLRKNEKNESIMERFLRLVNESGDSSWELLQNMYSSRHPHEQGISLALALSREFFRENGVTAACRVHGGGFAGTIQAYVPTESLAGYRAYMEMFFGHDAVSVLSIRSPGAVELIFE